MRAAGPVVDPCPCSACGKLIDPLRAGHVAIFDNRVHYFCNRRVCRAAFLGETVAPIAPSPEADREAERRARDEEEAKSQIVDAFAPASPDEGLPPPPVELDGSGPLEPLARTIMAEPPPRMEAPDGRDVAPLLLLLAVVAGTLAVSLSLLGTVPLSTFARIMLAGVGVVMLLGRALTLERDASDTHPAPVLAAPFLSVGVAVWAAFGKDRALAGEATSLAGFIVTVTAVGTWLVERARRNVSAERSWIEQALHTPGRRVTGEERPGEAKKDKVFDLKPGEQLVVEAGETAPVDFRIVDGEAEVLPWLGAATPVWRRLGDPVVAGAQVLRGRVRGVCTWAGEDRAFCRVLTDPRRRADAFAPIAKASRSLAERWAIVAALIGGVSALLAGRWPLEVAMAVIAIHAGLATPMIASVASVHVTRGILLGLRRGIVYKSSDGWDLAGKVAVSAFCARGTLLKGEPELSEVESTSTKLDETEVLALASGAERMAEDPVANAIVRAARAENIRPDGVRNPTAFPGLGVKAVSSSGEPLVVGSRALLVENRVSVASTEQRITELEAQGRTVVLVALGGRLVGLLALTDGLRSGARAAVQHLIDAEIEPVILSSDARETCEALGRSLDVAHIRPEILPSEQGPEVRRLMESGNTVAAIGHAGPDDGPLATADVGVALGAAGTTPGETAVMLASDDVRDAALSLALAKRVRVEARAGVAIAVVPAVVGAITVAFGLLPPAYAPIASLLGGVMALVHTKTLENRS